MKKLLFLVLLILISGCSRENSAKSTGTQEPHTLPESSVESIAFLILPSESAEVMYGRFLPLKYYIEKSLNMPVTLRIAKDHESAISEIGSGKVHIACLDPVTYCEARARHGSKVMPLVRAVGRGGATSRSVLVTKAGSGIERVVEMKGRRLALGNRQSTLSYLIPLAMLSDLGIREQDLSGLEFLQQEDRIALSVLIGRHDVGGISEVVAKKYAGAGLRIVKTSEPLSQYTICVSSSLSAPVRTRLDRALLSLADADVLRTIEKDVEKFSPAEDRDYDMVRFMIKNLSGRDYIEYGPKTVRVAVLPLYSPITMYDRYDPLMRYLSQKTGYDFKLVIPKDFDDFMHMVKGGKVDFSYQNPYVFALVGKEVRVHALVTTIGLKTEEKDSSDQFRGVIITQSNSAIKDIIGLKGKKVLIVSRKSAGGFLSQKLFLDEAGIDVDRDMHLVDVKRQENVILGVYRGEADAGFVRESALEVLKNEIDMGKMRILARTKSLPNWPFALCRDLPPELVKDVTRLLIGIRDQDIMGAARIAGFRLADDSEFDSLRRY